MATVCQANLVWERQRKEHVLEMRRMKNPVYRQQILQDRLAAEQEERDLRVSSQARGSGGGT